MAIDVRHVIEGVIGVGCLAAGLVFVGPLLGLAVPGADLVADVPKLAVALTVGGATLGWYLYSG